MSYIIAYDLGTGGCKASLHDEAGKTLYTSFLPYGTVYPKEHFHEQRPSDWWDKVCESTKILIKKSGVDNTQIKALAVSGHSLVCAPMNKDGKLLTDFVPIWSDTRAYKEAEDFFKKVSYDEWYETTGNGDPPECYSIMKLMWLKRNEPDIYNSMVCFLGSKDYINYMLTGNMVTDPSYASGTGAFDLKKWEYKKEYIEAAGLNPDIFPKIIPSDGLVGTVTNSAAAYTGLAPGTLVAAGGVDNACMALGARGIGEGRVYTSLGSSCWIAVTSEQPVIDHRLHPFVFAHCQKGYYTTGMSIFSGGSSHNWVRDNFYKDLKDEENLYKKLDDWAEATPIGANGVLFNPSLSGGSAQEKSPNIKGAFMGLSLSTNRADLMRATLEGIALDLKMLLDEFERILTLDDEMLLVGGGSKSKIWRRIFADTYNKTIVKTNIDQDAASLGAAALALKCAGIWEDFSQIDELHRVEMIDTPIKENVDKYQKLLEVFKESASFLADLGDKMAKL